MQKILYEAAIKRGVAFRLGCPVVALEEDDDTPAVVIKGGEKIEADVVVGADGKSESNLPRAPRCGFGACHLRLLG